VNTLCAIKKKAPPEGGAFCYAAPRTANISSGSRGLAQSGVSNSPVRLATRRVQNCDKFAMTVVMFGAVAYRLGFRDVFSEREMTKGRSVNIMAGNLAKDFRGRKSYRTADMRKSSMGGYESQSATVLPKYTEHANVDFVFEILVSQIFWNWSFFPHCTDIEFLTGAKRQLAFRGKRCDPSENGFIGCLLSSIV
jgi:hypothetical protein